MLCIHIFHTCHVYMYTCAHTHTHTHVHTVTAANKQGKGVCRCISWGSCWPAMCAVLGECTHAYVPGLFMQTCMYEYAASLGVAVGLPCVLCSVRVSVCPWLAVCIRIQTYWHTHARERERVYMFLCARGCIHTRSYMKWYQSIHCLTCSECICICCA
jgi:hypothetical protein